MSENFSTDARASTGTPSKETPMKLTRTLRLVAERLRSCDKYGTSYCGAGTSVDEFIELNKAGIDETSLTKEQIIEVFCYRKKRMRGTEWGKE